MSNKAQMVKDLKDVVSSYCRVCKAMNFDKLVSCPCDEKLHCDEAVALLRGSDSNAIVFGVKNSGYEDVAQTIHEYAVTHGMRPDDVVFHAAAKYMEETP